MTLKGWKELFAPRILQRGRSYYEEGAVNTIRREGDIIRATVLGSEPYQVEIDLKDERIAGWACDCPYGEDGTPCKHLAAVFYELDQMRDDACALVEQRPLRELIEDLDLETARALLLQLAERDEEAEDWIRLAVEPPSPQRLLQWKRKIDQMLRKASGRYGYIDYERAWDTMCQLDDLLSDVAEQFLRGGQVWEAFSLTSYGFWAAASCDMDDSDGGLSMLSETCHDLWSAQIEAASPEMRRRMHQWFREIYQDVDSLCQDLLSEMRWELFQDPEILQDDIDELDQMIQEEREKNTSEQWKLSQLVIQKLELMEKLGIPSEEIRQVEAEYRALPGIRRRIVGRLLENNQYDEAETLLREGKELDCERPGLVSEYSEELIGLYEKTGQTEKLQEELQFQVFRCRQSDLTYVEKLRERVPPNQWPELREELLAGKTLSSVLWEELLALDGLYDRLMERVAAQENLLALDRWEAVLWPRFPERVQDAYIRCMEQQMRLANNRKQYAAIIAYLKKLRKAPGRRDTVLAAQWRAAYPRRRSMLDELKKAGY